MPSLNKFHLSLELTNLKIYVLFLKGRKGDQGVSGGQGPPGAQGRPGWEGPSGPVGEPGPPVSVKNLFFYLTTDFSLVYFQCCICLLDLT